MKSPYEKRWFCTFVSVASGYFLYNEFASSHTVNLLNLLIFFCSFFLSLHTGRKQIDIKKKNEEYFIEQIYDNKHLSSDSISENDLKLTNTFNKKS